MRPEEAAELHKRILSDAFNPETAWYPYNPAYHNSDELNDIPNYAPTSEYATYDTGRRDDAGNPIMSSDVMDLMMTKSYEPQKESDWSVSNIADAVYTKLRDNFYDGSVQPVDFDNPYYTKDMTAPPEPITGKDLIKGAMPESFQASKLYADFFYGDDEKREQIKKAHDLTGIQAETIANDPEVWEKVMKIVQRAEKLKKVPGMLDANGDLNMRRVYEAMPYLKEIVEKRGTNEAVMMLHNAEGLQTVNDAYSNEFMRFAGSVATGAERGYYNIRKQMTYANAMIGRRKLTEDEQNWITALEKKKDELPEYSYGGIGQAVGAMIGGAAENIPMMASAQGIGVVAGGITLAVTKNPGTAANVGRVAAIAVMGLEIGGSQYEENLNKLDAKGRAMYTPTQAAALSATQGLAEGVIEQLALQKIARTIFGRGEAKSLRDLYAGAGAKDLALAAEGATANEAARTLIKERILGAAKAGAITFNTELQEEFAQQVSDMVIENMAQMALKGDDAEISSVRQILQKSTAAAIEAAPSIMGFGLIGFGGHVGAHTNTMLGARTHMENLIKDRLYRSVNENQNLINTVEAVGDNLKNVQELQGKAPDLVNEMLDSQNRRYGMETTSVDIVSLNQEEGGAALVQEIAAANNISAEELQACADGTGMLPVKTSTLQQMTTNLDEGKRKALFQNITKSSDLYTDKQVQHETKIVKEILGAFREKTEVEVGDSVDRYVESAFAEHEHRALARDILLADVDHPGAEIRRRMNRLDTDLAELTAMVQDDGSAETTERLAHIQPEIDKINAQKEALEAVASTIKSLQPGDVVATAELSPDARGVYHELAGQLGDAKSKKARTAARASALLAARYADRMAAIYSEVTGEPYTAADYMRDHLSVDARVTQMDAEALHQEAANSKAVELERLRNTEPIVVPISISEKEDGGKGIQNALDAFAALYPNGIDVQTRIGKVRVNRRSIKDSLTHFMYPAKFDTVTSLPEGLKIAAYIDSIPDVDGKDIMNHFLVYPIMYGGGKKYVVCRVREKFNVKKLYVHGVFSEEDIKKRGNALSQTQPPAERVQLRGAALYDSIIADFFNADNGKESFEQSAWHGSPHDFDGFDIGAIGTGEGAQVHGWGLYFAQDRNVSQGYKDRLTNTEILYDGKDIGTFPFSIHRILSAIKDFYSANGVSRVDEYIQNQVLLARKTLNDYERQKKVLQKAMDFLEKNSFNNVLENEDFSRMLTELGGDLETRIRRKIENEQRFYEDDFSSKDVRNFIQDDYMGMNDLISGQREIVKWLEEFDVKKLTINRKGGSLFEVEIPDDDVLLDEQKSFDEQTKFVQKKLKELFAGMDEDSILKMSYAGREKNYVLSLLHEAREKIALNERAVSIIKAALHEKSSEQVHMEAVDALNGDKHWLTFSSDAERMAYLRDQYRWYQSGVKEYKRQYDELYANRVEILIDYLHDGRYAYEFLSGAFGGDKAASLALNEVGIKGITYVGGRDGRCYVVFDDKAISIIEKYNQEHARETKGNITATYEGARRLISLMQSADQSTFMHEMAHNFLFDLEHIAGVAPESRYAKDLTTIQKWASWTKGMAGEYAGKASFAEFRDREDKILAAEKKGDTAEVERLKREWMQERFARGFEEYLRSGEAPAQGLRAVFRRFKAWLTRIYKDVTGAGVRASAEVEAIMARMIATDEEIEAAAVVKRAQRLQKIDPELLDADSAAKMMQWEAEAKERAKETLLKELIREMQGRDVDAHMEDYEAQLKAEMRENPVWQAEAVAETFGVGQVIASGYYPTVEAYEKALKDAGGGFDAAYNRQMREERERYKTEMPNAEAIAQRAEEVFASQEYTARQTALEGELLNEYIKAYDNAPQRLKDAMIGVARALEREEDAPLEKAVTALKYAFRWQEKQAQEIEELRALVAATKDEGAAAIEEMREADKVKLKEMREKKDAASKEQRNKMREKFAADFNKFKLSAMQNLEAVRSLRDSSAGRVAAMRAYAQQHLETVPVHEATNARHWMRQVQSAAKEAERHLTNMLRKNNGIEKEDTGDKDLAAARAAKTRQLAMEAMTHESVKLKRELDRMLKYFARREKNLANDKTAKIDGNHRYFIHHLLYVFGLRRSDGMPLMGDGARSWPALMEELKTSNDGLDGVEIPDWLSSAATARDKQRKYTQLSMQELRDFRMLIEFLYVTGRNKNTLLTSGENVDEVAARMYENYEEHIGIQEGGKGVSEYMVKHLKAETMLKVIGGKDGAIMHYLYNTLFDAQEKKSEALEKNAERLKTILEQYYTDYERQQMSEKKLGIALTDGTELTKENVLSMALNWGNEGNRSRLVAGLSEKTPYTEKDITEIFEKTMTAKDWAFVQEMWDYLNEHGDAVNEVVEKTTGTPMKRVAPDAFTIVDAETKKTLNIRGGYYPIRYKPGKPVTTENELATMAESVGGARVFGAGMGSTKNRAAGPSSKPMPLDLSLDVLYRHIDQQIHIATMRIACRDVYKLLNHAAVEDMVTKSFGGEAYKELKEWVETTWQEPINKRLYVENLADELRANTVTAIMAFRVSTAALNFANIAPMADRLGAVNAVRAMLLYLKNWNEIRDFVRNDSVFMRNRAHNMDRDLNTQGKNIFGGKTPFRKFLIQWGAAFMKETDMLCSIPTYYWTYRERYNKEVMDGTDEIIARERAHREAHEAVRSIFGSSDAIDRSAYQRDNSLFIKSVTPFFSFFNAQMNAVWEKYYAGRYDQHKESFVKRYAAFVRSFLYRYLAMSAIETLLRMGMEAFAGGDDKKKKEEWYKRFLREWAANSLSGVTSAFVGINAASELVSGMIKGELYHTGRYGGVVSAAFDRVFDPMQKLYALPKDNSKIDALDFGRALTKAYLGTKHGVSDTLTDGFWNTARFMTDNYRLNNPDDLWEFFAKSILDKKLKQK